MFDFGKEGYDWLRSIEDDLIDVFEDIEWDIVHNFDPITDSIADVEPVLKELETCAKLITDVSNNTIYMDRYESVKDDVYFEFK